MARFGHESIACKKSHFRIENEDKNSELAIVLIFIEDLSNEPYTTKMIHALVHFYFLLANVGTGTTMPALPGSVHEEEGLTGVIVVVVNIVHVQFQFVIGSQTTPTKIIGGFLDAKLFAAIVGKNVVGIGLFSDGTQRGQVGGIGHGLGGHFEIFHVLLNNEFGRPSQSLLQLRVTVCHCV